MEIIIKSSRRLRWACHIGKMEEGKTAFKIVAGKNYLYYGTTALEEF